jgi:hypothetical protein
VLFLCLSLVVIDAAPLAAPVKLDKATSKLIETSYNQGLQASSKLNALRYNFIHLLSPRVFINVHLNLKMALNTKSSKIVR